MPNDLVTKDYLHQEMEIVRKEMEILRKDMEVMRKETRLELAQLDKKFTLYFAVLLFAVLFVNKDAIALLANFLGLLKR